MVDINKIKRGMLSSPQINYLAREGILIQGFSEKNLGPASYHMRISGPFITSENNINVEYTLSDTEDTNTKNVKKIVLQPNTLTYVTTYEKFNLPSDFIARFNLKSKWVHKGLLLGTGPIVDPGITDRLLIPLHNFSNSRIEIRNMDELLSVEFTRTSDPDEKFILEDGSTICGVENKSATFDFYQYIARNGGHLPGSSVLSALNEAQEERVKVEGAYVKFQKIGFITGIALLIALITLVVTTWSIVDNSNKLYKDAERLIQNFESQHVRIFQQNDTVSSHLFVSTIDSLNSTIQELNSKYNKIIEKNSKYEEYIQILENKIIHLESNINNNKRSSANNATN